MSENEHAKREFAQAYEEYADAIFRHCYFRVHDREQARDLMQEAFTRVWDYRSRGNKIENMRAFLYRTAHNLVVNYFERNRPHASLDSYMEDYGSDSVADNTDVPDVTEKIDAELLAARLHDLPAPYRDVLVMRFIDELPVKEIARMLNENENTISVRLYRGLKKLKKLFNSEP